MHRFILLSTLATALVAVAVAAAVNPAEGVRFSPVARSGVTGTATLAANGIGTKVTVRLVGLAPGTTARVLLRTGRYPRLSASFAKAVEATSDARGVARASSAVRFRGEPVSWSIVADGEHVLTVVAGRKVVAYAAIPGMD